MKEAKGYDPEKIDLRTIVNGVLSSEFAIDRDVLEGEPVFNLRIYSDEMTAEDLDKLRENGLPASFHDMPVIYQIIRNDVTAFGS